MLRSFVFFFTNINECFEPNKYIFACRARSNLINCGLLPMSFFLNLPIKTIIVKKGEFQIH